MARTKRNRADKSAGRSADDRPEDRPGDDPDRPAPDGPAPEPPGTELERSAEVGDLVTRLMAEDDTDNKSRAKLLGRLSAALAGSARAAGAKGVAGGRWVTDLFANEIAPRIPIRDRATLIAHYNGLTGEELAEALARNAAHGTTTVGAAGGALAAVQFTAPPLLLTAPAQIAAETVVVAAIEVKLLGELHEVYGVPVGGTSMQRTSGYLVSWARKRGIDPLQGTQTFAVALGAAAKTALRKRLMRLMGRHLTTLGPYLTGAVAGGALNRAGTLSLARAVRHDLRMRAPSLEKAPPSVIDGATGRELPAEDERDH